MGAIGKSGLPRRSSARHFWIAIRKPGPTKAAARAFSKRAENGKQRTSTTAADNEALRPQAAESRWETLTGQDSAVTPKRTTPQYGGKSSLPSRLPVTPRREHLQHGRRHLQHGQDGDASAPSIHKLEPRQIPQAAPNGRTLYDELFPRESPSRRPPPAGRPSTNPPPASLRAALPDLVHPSPPLGHNPRFPTSPPAAPPSSVLSPRALAAAALRARQLALLVLFAGFRPLAAADFRRLVPRGAHLANWPAHADPVLQVLPERDAATLRAGSRGRGAGGDQRSYLLLFATRARARAYQDRAYALHALREAYAGRAWPERGERSTEEGEDVRGLLEDYALGAPGQRLRLHVLDAPFRQNTARVLENGGYRPLVRGAKDEGEEGRDKGVVGPDGQTGTERPVDDRTGRAVLLWVEGAQPRTEALRDMVVRDGVERREAWSAVEREDGVLKLGREVMEVQEENQESEPRGPDAGDKQRQDEEAGGSDWFSRWMLTFGDEGEARRFVRRWHCKPFKWAKGERPDPLEPPRRVHAELLW